MPLPAVMTVITHTPGGPETLIAASAPMPVPAADEVLIRVAAAGVNRPDVLQRSGAYPPPPGANPLLGLEASGEVVAIGAAVQHFAVGDRVVALTNGGAYAEYCTAPELQTLPWPKGLDAIQAAAIPETYFTVWANVFILGRLQRGESLLVHGGSSGIGVTALQLAHAFGATAYATAGSAEKLAACLKLGATAAINYREEDFLDAIRRLTDKRGVDVVLDMVGAPYFARNLRCLALEGRLVQIAFLQGSKVEEFDLLPIMMRRLTLTGSTMRARSTAQKGVIAQAVFDHVWPLLEEGLCLPVIHHVFPLAQAADAHRLMEEGSHIGKIMLEVRP
jgi:NADPH2:quinone reductase